MRSPRLFDGEILVGMALENLSGSGTVVAHFL